MRTILIFCAVLVFLMCLSCEERTKTNTLPNDIKALEDIRKEKQVEEAFITDVDILYVSMRANGESKKGYACYLCNTLYEYGAKTDHVKIVEYGTADANRLTSAYGDLVGECYCSEWIEGFHKPKTDN